jgi:hypothetical protein
MMVETGGRQCSVRVIVLPRTDAGRHQADDAAHPGHRQGDLQRARQTGDPTIMLRLTLRHSHWSIAAWRLSTCASQSVGLRPAA